MISVCLATHNGEKYIHDQIKSILSQLHAEDEIVISDDGSSDKTLEIIKAFKDDRIKIVFQKSPKGLMPHEYATLNFENALRNAKGEYIFLSDQDDVWMEDKIKITMEYLKEYDYVVSDAYVTDAELNVLSTTRFTKEEQVHFNKYLAVIMSTPYQGSCAAFKRCILDKALPFPQGIQSHDRWIGNVAAFFFNYRIIPEKLILYRRHESTTSNSFGKKGSSYGIWRKIRYKLGYIKGLVSIIGK